MARRLPSLSAGAGQGRIVADVIHLRQVTESAVAVLVFASVFLLPRGANPLHAVIKDLRVVVSFGAGLSAAYVFVHVLPALNTVRTAFVASAAVELRHEGRALYLVALLGFLVFYSLDTAGSRAAGAAGQRLARLAFLLNVGGFAVYAWLLSYLLLHHLGEGPSSTIPFAVAVAFHLFGVHHGLQHRFGSAYERRGRFAIAAMCLLGWSAGWLFSLPQTLLALVTAFVAGAIIMNSAIMELPAGREVRALPFLLGGLGYGAVLLLLH